MTIPKFEYANISDNPTREEIDAEIERLEYEFKLFKNLEQAYKILMNSMYGATGFQYFTAYNTNVAESVTLQGQEQIKEMAKLFDDYFIKEWHKDYDVHEKIGISNVKQLNQKIVIYIDTDSNYLTFNHIYRNGETDLDEKEFSIRLYNYVLIPLIEKRLKSLAEKFHADFLDAKGKPYQEFEMEMLCHSGLWLSKKKYIYDPMWEPGKKDEYGNLLSDGGTYFESGSDLQFKGVEIVKSDTPIFVREHLKEIAKYILTQGENFEVRELAKLLKDVKKQFALADIDDISITKGCNGYEKWILDDSGESLVYESGTPIQVRAAAHHNFILNQPENKRYKQKYELLKSGDKIKYYYCVAKSQNSENVFGYSMGFYPIEINPPEYDYDMMFEKVMLQPINRFLEAMKAQKLNRNLIAFRTLL